MVEYVNVQEEIPKSDKINDEKKRLIVAFYFWNLNLYLVSLLLFSHNLFISIYLYIIILFIVYRYMFGVQRHTRAIITNLIIWILFIYYFDGFVWQNIMLWITTFINLKYYILVVKNGTIFKKSTN